MKNVNAAETVRPAAHTCPTVKPPPASYPSNELMAICRPKAPNLTFDEPEAYFDQKVTTQFGAR